MPRILSLDVETCSEANLKTVGSSRYAADPTTFCTVAAWAFDKEPVSSISARQGLKADDLPFDVLDHIKGGGTIRAWNASFEMNILRSVFGLTIKPAQMSCTMQRALYSGLPGSLGDAGPALGLNTVKDKKAHQIMMRCAKPKTIDIFGNRTYWLDVPGYLLDLEIYCRGDVEAERAIAEFVPELPRTEQLLSVLDRKANLHGIRVDLELIRKMIVLAELETQRLNQRTAGLTIGAVSNAGTQTARLLAWFKTRGLDLPDLGKKTVAATLESAHDAGVDPVAIVMLSIRRKIAKSSLAKLKTMLAAVETDGRIRGTLAYYGAQRTGRFAGRIIQPQNFPRPEGHPEIAIEGILDGLDRDGLRLFHGEPLTVLSHALRGTIIPSVGKILIAIDLSQIEARVIAWLCGQEDLLIVFRHGEDVYQYTADKIGLPTRQAGKATVLGLGFGQGFERFVEFAAGYGVEITKLQSLQIVTDWRNANQNIVNSWYEVDRAVKWCIENWHKDRATVWWQDVLGGRVKIMVSAAKNHNALLTILLPSGRRLFYRNPRLVHDPEKNRDAIVFSGVDQFTKQWGPIRTWGSKLIENIVQAVARDVITEAAIVVDNTMPAVDLLFSVHDELVFEVDDDAHAKDRYDQVHMITVAGAPWNAGLPIAASGGLMRRYGK